MFSGTCSPLSFTSVLVSCWLFLLVFTFLKVHLLSLVLYNTFGFFSDLAPKSFLSCFVHHLLPLSSLRSCSLLCIVFSIVLAFLVRHQSDKIKLSESGSERDKLTIEYIQNVNHFVVCPLVIAISQSLWSPTPETFIIHVSRNLDDILLSRHKS
jgi:hypothetical protein